MCKMSLLPGNSALLLDHSKDRDVEAPRGKGFDQWIQVKKKPDVARVGPPPKFMLHDPIILFQI